CHPGESRDPRPAHGIIDMTDHQSLEFDYRPSLDQQAATPAFHAVIVVGAGPVGLSLAIDLAQRGIAVLLLDHDHKLSTGSPALGAALADGPGEPGPQLP